MFIIWVILLFFPLFSELEFFGVKIKKEVAKAVEKSNEEVKASISNLQQLISQIQVSNSVAPQFTINGGALPSEGKIDKLTEELHLYNEQNKNKQAEQQDKVNIPTQNLELFKMRYGIEAKLNDAMDLIGYNGKNHMKNDRATIRDLTNPIVRLMDNDNIMMLSLVGKEIITEEMLYSIKKK